MSSFDLLMTKLKKAKECPKEKRTDEQKKLLKEKNCGPTYNSLFNGKKQTYK